MPGFLEASSTGSRDLYARHGYELLGEPYAAPNGALFWPMWREPGNSLKCIVHCRKGGSASARATLAMAAFGALAAVSAGR